MREKKKQTGKKLVAIHLIHSNSPSHLIAVPLQTLSLWATLRMH